VPKTRTSFEIQRTKAQTKFDKKILNIKVGTISFLKNEELDITWLYTI
jgi:hypothetical protein